MTRDRVRLLGVTLAAFLLAFALRLGPLYRSPLPFNTDGIAYATRVRDSLRLGHLPIEAVPTDSIGYTALLSLVSALTGHPPLTIAQPTSAAIGAATVLVGAAVAYRIGRGRDWSPVRCRQAAFLAGALLAVEGLYLYRTMPTDEQTAGLLLVPALVVAVDRWLTTRRRGWAALALTAGVALPPLHNLSGLAGAFAVSCVLAVRLVRLPSWPVAFRVAAVGTAAWVYAVGYHVVVAARTPAVLAQVDRVARVPGLFLAWILLGVLAAAWFVTTSHRLQRRSVLAAVVVPFGLLAVNAVRTVYPGTAGTPRRLLLVLLPLVVPTALGAAFVHYAGRDRSVGPAAVALVLAPLALVGFALTAGLSFEYLALAYRAQLFAHLPLLALAGIAAVAVADRVSRPALAVGLVVVLLASAGASAPVAYAGLEVFTFKGSTTEAEFAATGFAVSTFGTVATDDHLARVAGYHGGGATQEPVRAWLRAGAPPPACPVLAQRSWTTTGAQSHPQPPAALPPGEFREWRDRQNVVYVAASGDPVLVALPRGNPGRCVE